MEEAKEERQSAILFVQADDKRFICNRNSDQWNNLFKDKIMRWFEYEGWDLEIESSNVKILEICNLSNINLKDQKELNTIKQAYIEQYNAEHATDEKLCNIALNNWSRSMRISIKKHFENVIDELQGCSWDDMYEVVTKLWKDPKWQAIAKMRKHEAYDKWFSKASNEQKKKLALLMVCTNYWVELKDDTSFPFSKGFIRYNTICRILKAGLAGAMSKERIMLLASKISRNSSTKHNIGI